MLGDDVLKTGDVFNPFKLFVGLFIPNALARYGGVSSSAKLVWGRLSQFAGENGACFPSQKTLAKEIGVGERQVRRLLLELEQQKFIAYNRPQGKGRLNHLTCEYVFLWHEIFQNYRSGRRGANVRSAEDVNVRPTEDLNVQSLYKGVKRIKKQENQNTTFPSDSQAVRLSELLLGFILTRKPDYKKPNIQLWAKSIDLMIRVDHRDPQKIADVICWSQQDSFWQNNILSTAKLREQFDTLDIKRLSGGKVNVGNRYSQGKRESSPQTRGDQAAAGKYAHVGEELTPEQP